MTTGTDLEPQQAGHAYDDLLNRCRALEPLVTSVVFPCEATALAGAVDAAQARLITPRLSAHETGSGRSLGKRD